MRRAVAWRVVRWGLVAAWLGVIWLFGESQALLHSPADPMLHWLARKGLHLAVYGVLGGLLVVALGPRRRWGY